MLIRSSAFPHLLVFSRRCNPAPPLEVPVGPPSGPGRLSRGFPSLWRVAVPARTRPGPVPVPVPRRGTPRAGLSRSRDAWGRDGPGTARYRALAGTGPRREMRLRAVANAALSHLGSRESCPVRAPPASSLLLGVSVRAGPAGQGSVLLA